MQKYKKNFLKSRGMKEPRDDLLCEMCMGKDNPRLASDIHHIRYRSLGGSDEGDNLIALCRQRFPDEPLGCHDRAHMGLITEDELKARVQLILEVIHGEGA